MAAAVCYDILDWNGLIEVPKQVSKIKGNILS